jgi:tetratricopeptide (TPR) repeat protein
MKKIIFFLIFIVGMAAQAQNPDSLFVQANKSYQQEDYLKALELYKEIENQNVVSGELFYNMANVYYKTNKVAYAIYYYEKALRLEPNNKDILFNLEFAKRMTLDNIEELPKSISQKFRDSVVLKFTYNTWAIISVSFAFLFAILFLLYHFSYGTSLKRIYFITSGITVIFVALSILFSYQNYKYVSTTKTAIIFAQQTQVKSAPTKSSEVNFELHEGTKVFVLESLDNWVKIKIADGKMGWIEEEDLKEL